MKQIGIAPDGFREPGQLCKLGEQVRFENHDTKDHIITGPFETFTLKVGEHKVVTLSKAGTFEFASNGFPRKGSLNVQT